MKDMEIDSIEAWACQLPLDHPLDLGRFTITAREYVAVRVQTKGGLVSDCLGMTRRAPVDVAILDVVAPHLLGRDAVDVSARMHELRTATRALEQDGILGRARSLVELCLWDLRAQAVDMPLWRVLGGFPRRLPVMLVEGYAMPDESDAAFAERLAARVGEGYSMLKIEAASYQDPRTVASRLTETRQRVGDDVRLVVDLLWLWPTAGAALRSAAPWVDLGVEWVEDPMPRDHVEELVHLRRALPAAVGCGDDATRPADLISLLDAGAIDVLRLDATSLGVSAVSELMARASSRAARTSFHIHPEIHRHFAFAWPGCDHVESYPMDGRFDRAHDLLEEPFMTTVERGTATPPEAPGTGLRLDLAAVASSAYRHGRLAA